MQPHYVFKQNGGKARWEIHESRDGPLIETRIIVLKPEFDCVFANFSGRDCKPALVGPLTINDLINHWRSDNPTESSPEWQALAPTTQRTWGSGLKRIQEKWGKRFLSDFEEPRIKAEIVAWRDSRCAQPRGADIGVVVLQALLRFGQLRGLVGHNPADGIPSLYRGGDRAEIIWTDDEIREMTGRGRTMGKDNAIDGLRLAAATGLRRDDLVSLMWDHVGKFAICKKARKSSRRRRRYVSIPRLPELDQLLEELRLRPREPGIENILVDSRGRPWEPNRLTREIGKVRDAAGIAYVDPDNGERRKKHLHDARGTFATRLIRAVKISDEEVADIMGWSPAEVVRIRRAYVDQTSVMIAIGQRIAGASQVNSG